MPKKWKGKRGNYLTDYIGMQKIFACLDSINFLTPNCSNDYLVRF